MGACPQEQHRCQASAWLTLNLLNQLFNKRENFFTREICTAGKFIHARFLKN
ncbi:hypothetical protein HAL013_04590 [Helicobacter ailurogastricus]|uniref:Uncharacterized protein n=1 Tax=Helicobacter ailurogastricus TaxID=1578720 RepID=A0A0K2X515_9HELI|nr:hypothetical protein HAL011_07770 [Helicobacter ailurogastricus]CRF42290.1 hypothetical protein HAL013_04590 [Helicobacter ailurogastricus]CRF44812.1 hypothetical protein HAL09_14240 [Helicobacter ailurogastricus]